VAELQFLIGFGRKEIFFQVLAEFKTGFGRMNNYFSFACFKIISSLMFMLANMYFIIMYQNISKKDSD